MKTINGDIFEGSWDGMVHCANLHHVMGSGIAKIIKSKFPEAYEADVNAKLGHFSYATVFRNGECFDVFNLYGQKGIGNDGHPLNRNARYDAIHDGVWRICELIESQFKKDYTLAFPYKMASDRAGGDFNIVSSILESVEKEFPQIKFVIYKL
jgi:hypothetical protein